MAPRVKVTKEDIVKTAVSLVRESGEEGINARAVAAALGCSTQPVFSNFASMEALRAAVSEAAFGRYLGFLRAEAEKGKYPAYKAFGMAYIRFASEERELFKLLFMCDRGGEPLGQTEDFETSVQMLMKTNGLTEARARRMHFEMWSCVHGLAVMAATSFLTQSEAAVSEMLSDVYQGLRARHILEETDASNRN